jgi:heat shock protein HtpX
MPAEIKEMAFENPRIGLAGIFATHPPIEKRIEALVKYAGGRKDTQSRPQRRTPVEAENAQTRQNRPPFGRRGPWTRGH